MEPYSLDHLYKAFSRTDFVLFLPRNSDLEQIASYVDDEQDVPLPVVHYCMYGASKALCVFFGEFQLD